MNPFKFPEEFPLEHFEQDKIIFPITEEYIQQEAESEIDRQLTKEELQRFFSTALDCPQTNYDLWVWVRMVIIALTDSKSELWKNKDNDPLPF